MTPDRRTAMLAGIEALRDATRALRGAAGRKGAEHEAERGMVFDLAQLADRLASFADDQSEDDWEQFWVTARDVETLRRHTEALAQQSRGLSASTVPALCVLGDTLATITQAAHDVSD